jgi:hypothetical protein
VERKAIRFDNCSEKLNVIKKMDCETVRVFLCGLASFFCQNKESVEILTDSSLKQLEMISQWSSAKITEKPN